jgi:hypothetical protein
VEYKVEHTFLHKAKQEQNEQCLLGIALLVTPIIKSTCNQGTPATLAGLGYCWTQGHICMYVICLMKCSEFFHSISFHQLLLASLHVSILLLDFLLSTRELILVGQHYTFEYTLLVCFDTSTTSYRFPLGEVMTTYFFHTFVVLKHINGFRN